MPTVHLSLPLTGPDARAGRDLLRGAELALERAGAPHVSLVVGDERERATNAARAAADPEAVAYVGEVRSAAVAETQAVLAEAGLLQVAPLATSTRLRGATLLRLCGDDRVAAEAIAAWLAAQGVEEVLVVHDRDEGYGVPVAALCVGAARARGLTVRSRPVWDAGEHVEGDVNGAGAVLYVGVAGSGATDLWHALHGASPAAWLLGTEGTALPWLAHSLAPDAAARTRFFVGPRAGASLYGAEAVRLVLDALARGGADRAGIARAALAAGHAGWLARDVGRVAVEGGELVWDVGP